MTTVAVRGRVMAADSMESFEASGLALRTEKLYRRKIGRHDVILGLSGETFSGLIFVDWYPGAAKLAGRARPPQFDDPEADFEALILERSGIYICDRFCRAYKVGDPFAAVGSGAKAALAALEMGASARRAVEVACKYDLHSRPPIVTERLR